MANTTPHDDIDFYKNNEINDWVNNGFIVAGTTDVTKWKLSAKGIALIDRIIKRQPVKDQAFLRMFIGGNAEKTTAEIKAFMG